MKKQVYIILGVFLFAGGLYGGYTATVSGGTEVNVKEGEETPSGARSKLVHRKQGAKVSQNEKEKITREEVENYKKEWNKGKNEGEFTRIFESLFKDVDDKLLLEKYGEQGWGLLMNLMDEWAEQHPVEMLNYFKDNKTEWYATEWDYIFQRCATKKPEEMWDYFMANKKDCYSSSNLSSLISGSAAQDPAGTWTKLQSLTATEQNRAIGDFLAGLASKSPEKLKDYMSRIDWESAKDNYDLKYKIIYDVVREKNVDVSVWIDQLPKDWQEELKSQRGIVQHEDIASFEEGMASLTPKEQSEKIKVDGYRLAEKEGFLKVWELAEKYSPDMKGYDHSNLLRNWVDREPETFKKWYGELAEGTVKDMALYAYVQSEPFLNHKNNLDLAVQLKDENMRNDSVRNIMGEWYNESPEEALKKMEELNMKENEIDRIKKWKTRFNYKPKLGSVSYGGGD